MYVLLAMGMLLVSSNLALADCHRVATGSTGQVYQCDPPQPPAPPPPPVKCSYMSGALLCTGRIDQGTAPANCGWRKGAYVCW